MKKNKIYYTEFHVAGVQYHDAIEVIEGIKVGNLVTLVRDEDNKFDPNAIAVMYNDAHIGYVPRSENDSFTPFLDMGWIDIFEARISRVCREAHPESQLHVQVKIIRRSDNSSYLYKGHCE